MSLDRRSFLKRSGIATATTAVLLDPMHWVGVALAAAKEHPLLALANELSKTGTLTVEGMEEIRLASKNYAGDHGRITPELQNAFFAIERKFGRRFTPDAAARFQTMVAQTGGRVLGPIGAPEDHSPYWLKDPSPLEKFRSTPRLPVQADYVVVGAGLTGASTTRHLVDEAKAGKSVVVLESGDRPASGASGRNGGNIEAMKENFLRDYRGFVEVQKDFIRERFPHLPESVLTFQADRQARILLEFSRDNVEIMRKVIQEDGVHCGASFDGWLRIAATAEEEKALGHEIAFAERLGMNFEVWSAAKIKEMTGIDSKYGGRFIKDSGHYHPGKFVDGVFRNAVKDGVKLYTQVETTQVLPQKDGTYLVRTQEGTIRAKKVILATNAYTREILHDLTFLEPRVSQISNFEHVHFPLKGNYTMTTDNGDLYWNYPTDAQYVDSKGARHGMVHIGGGLDTPFPQSEVHRPPFMPDVFEQVHHRATTVLPITKDQPPVRAWSGAMAFTEDRMPVLSFYVDPQGVEHKGMIIAMACNGYGGSQCAKAGEVVAEMAKTGKAPASIPDDMFSMRRFLTKKPLFSLDVPESFNCEKGFSEIPSR